MTPQRVITVVGCHAEGEVGDVITGGVLPPAGVTMMERKVAMERDHDHIRRTLICEPRGSVARHVNLLTPPLRADCVAGAIVMEPTEYPPMSGSNTMCIATVLLETGIVAMVEPETRFRLDMPGGPVDIVAECRAGKCVSVTLKNVPAFAFAIDVPLEVEGWGTIHVDIAYGGMIYAIVQTTELGLEVVPEAARALAELGEKIRHSAREQHRVVHPEFPEIDGVSIVQFAGPLRDDHGVSVGHGVRVEHGVERGAEAERDARRVTARNTCIVSPGRSDRSPTGTGTTARMAALHARGTLGIGDGLTHESIIGSQFHGTIVGETTVGPYRAIEATIRGRAWITGFHQYIVDATDPWPSGYVVGDTWGTSTIVSQT